MGGLFSKAPPPTPKLLDTPWRQFNWGNKHDDLQYVNNYKPQTEGQQLRILLNGPVGAGKSSFLNSVKSVLQNRICLETPVRGTSHSSCTKKYKTHRIPMGDSDSFFPFVFNDMMGLNASSNRKARQIHVKDVKRALKGHVKEGYKFNPECKLSKDDPHYNRTPSANDRVDILVFVIDASTVSSMNQETREVIEDIRDEADDMEVPKIVIFTRIDEACPKINREIKNVFKSISLKKKIEQFSTDTGISLNCIFPVKNYNSEYDLKTDADALILDTLRHIIERGDDFLNRKFRS
ncbi:interferon-induced protein 44-like [Archocentrus centrarchus]|uniref:interferon-induced protein 44-like n=1 Tax=Archocentrus centrarchus TaxID=63155 RepID=UPI0011EA2692|nr:interferon-induced protein 44-like [Archocentrus centrarchus]